MSSPWLEVAAVSQVPGRPVPPTVELVGSKAGEVWRYLESHGETSILKLKSETLSSATVLHLAMGWLLREGKIRFAVRDGHLSVQLAAD